MANVYRKKMTKEDAKTNDSQKYTRNNCCQNYATNVKSDTSIQQELGCC